MNIVELDKNDTLILKSDLKLSKEALERLNNIFKENNINILILPKHIDIVGVKRADKL